MENVVEREKIVDENSTESAIAIIRISSRAAFSLFL